METQDAAPDTSNPSEIVNPDAVNPDTLDPQAINPQAINPDTLDPQAINPEPQASYVKLAMRNMVRKRGISLQHFFLTFAGLLGLLIGLSYLTR